MQNNNMVTARNLYLAFGLTDVTSEPQKLGV